MNPKTQILNIITEYTNTKVGEQIAGSTSFVGDLKFVANGNRVSEFDKQTDNVYVSLDIDGGGKRSKPADAKDSEEINTKTIYNPN